MFLNIYFRARFLDHDLRGASLANDTPEKFNSGVAQISQFNYFKRCILGTINVFSVPSLLLTLIVIALIFVMWLASIIITANNLKSSVMLTLAIIK